MFRASVVMMMLRSASESLDNETRGFWCWILGVCCFFFRVGWDSFRCGGSRGGTVVFPATFVAAVVIELFSRQVRTDVDGRETLAGPSLFWRINS